MGHRKPWSGLIIRIAGLVLLAIAAFSARRLFARAMTPPDGLEYFLALIAFASASAGCAMTTLGAHLFDQVEVSARWRRL